MNKKVKILLVFGLIIVFFLLTFMISNNTIDPTDIKIPNITVNEWIEETKKDQHIITIIGSSTCPHCQEYKPIMAKLSKKHNFKMYFFEGDTMESEEYEKLITSYEGLEHEYIPFTVITKNNSVLYTTTGKLEEKEIEQMLREYGVIK